MKNNDLVGTIVCKFSSADFMNVKIYGALICASFEKISFNELSPHAMIIRKACDEIFGEENVAMSPYEELCGDDMCFGYIIRVTSKIENDDLAIVNHIVPRYFYEILGYNDNINDMFDSNESEADMNMVDKMKDEFLESNPKKTINRPFVVELNGVKKLNISGKITEWHMKTRDKLITRDIVGYVDGLAGHARELRIKNYDKNCIKIGFEMEKFADLLKVRLWDNKMYRITVREQVNGKGNIDELLTNIELNPVDEKFILD